MNNIIYNCYHGPFPSKENPHLAIIVCKIDNKKVLILPISSIKNNKRDDISCKISPYEIQKADGKIVLNKESFIYYGKAYEILESELEKKDIYEYRCKINPQLKLKIKRGAENNINFSPRYLKYFQ